jgi:hypothetical protein
MYNYFNKFRQDSKEQNNNVKELCIHVKLQGYAVTDAFSYWLPTMVALL